jgi:glycosyltransferase involved in cell wall biosynthesis
VKISIITVCYNSAPTIRDTFNSVLNQTYSNIEYIVVDGNSSDGTLSVIKEYEPIFNGRMRWISEKDNGLYDAMNKGIRMATGEIIGSINSDDWYELDAIENVVKIYIEAGFDMFYADLRIIKHTGNIIKHSKKSHIISSRYWNHPTTFITKDIYNKYQYKLESIYDDFDLMVRIRQNGHNIVVRNIMIANFRFGGISTQKNIKDTVARIKIRYQIYRSNKLSRMYIFECVLVEFVKYFMA